MNDAFDGEDREHEHDMGVWAAIKSHPRACFWAFTMCFTIVMESFDMFLNGNFVAQIHFQRTFVKIGGAWVIPTKWQSALFQSGQCGASVGPVTNRLGYRWTTILALTDELPVFYKKYNELTGLLDMLKPRCKGKRQESDRDPSNRRR